MVVGVQAEMGTLNHWNTEQKHHPLDADAPTFTK
jgi:hypothetical protein